MLLFLFEGVGAHSGLVNILEKSWPVIIPRLILKLVWSLTVSFQKKINRTNKENMDWGFLVLNSILLGVGLAVDAFSVSIADAIAEPNMKKNKKVMIALTFAIFQIAMPLIGWICVHTISSYFTFFQRFIPYIALALLLYIGIKMLLEARNNDKEEIEKAELLSLKALLVQAVATSIDALSVGFAISEYNAAEAVLSSLIIGVVTFFICLFGVWLGKKAGEKLESRATIIGGVVLILIGLEIFITNVFF